MFDTILIQIEELIDRQVGPDVRGRKRAFSRSTSNKAGLNELHGDHVVAMYADVATALAFTWADGQHPEVCDFFFSSFFRGAVIFRFGKMSDFSCSLVL